MTLVQPDLKLPLTFMSHLYICWFIISFMLNTKTERTNIFYYLKVIQAFSLNALVSKTVIVRENFHSMITTEAVILIKKILAPIAISKFKFKRHSFAPQGDVLICFLNNRTTLFASPMEHPICSFKVTLHPEPTTTITVPSKICLLVCSAC